MKLVQFSNLVALISMICVDKVEYHLLSVHVHVSFTLYSYGLNFVVNILGLFTSGSWCRVP